MNQAPKNNQSNQSHELRQATRPRFYAHLFNPPSGIWQEHISLIAKHRKTAITVAASVFLGFSLAIAKLGFADNENLNLDTVYSDAKLNAEVEQRSASCQKGEKGTVGESMITALKIHQDFAAISPPVEKMFNESGCFDKLNKLVDLSVAIPSISSIASSLVSALTEVAKKKVCKAVNKASDMLSDPINAGLQKIGQYTDLNGLANRTISQQLSRVDPELGNSFVYTPPGFNETLNIGVDGNQQLDQLLKSSSGSLMGDHQNNVQSMQNAMQNANSIQPKATIDKIQQDADAYNRIVDAKNAGYREDGRAIIPRITQEQVRDKQANAINGQLNTLSNIATAPKNSESAAPSTIGVLNGNSNGGQNAQNTNNQPGFSSFAK